MMGFQEIGFIIRLIFIYKFNLKKMNNAHKISENNETGKDFKVGLMTVLILIGWGVFGYLLR